MSPHPRETINVLNKESGRNDVRCVLGCGGGLSNVSGSGGDAAFIRMKGRDEVYFFQGSVWCWGRDVLLFCVYYGNESDQLGGYAVQGVEDVQDWGGSVCEVQDVRWAGNVRVMDKSRTSGSECCAVIGKDEDR